jgi:AraC-like DNA-binding protein
MSPAAWSFSPSPEVHGGVDTTLQPAEWYWIHLHFPPKSALPGLTHGETHDLHESYQNTTLCMFPGSNQLRDCFARFLVEHRKPCDHSEVIARAQLHELMICVIRDHNRAAANRHAAVFSVEIRHALAWMDRNLCDPLSIPQMAAASGLSQSHFRETFHKATGLTPSDYLMRRRVTRAKELLDKIGATELGITEIAFKVGFQSSSYFAAVFKKLTGMTPSEYREQPAKAQILT